MSGRWGGFLVSALSLGEAKNNGGSFHLYIPLYTPMYHVYPQIESENMLVRKNLQGLKIFDPEESRN